MDNVAADYTNWDDMVNYMSNRDSVWARDNLASVLQSHKLNAVWVYDLSAESVYFINNCTPEESKLLPIPPGVFYNLRKEKGIEFFVKYPEGLFLICGATIHRTTDLKRVLPSHGYFFVAKSIDKVFLNEINALTGAVAQINDTGSVSPFSTTSSEIKLSYPLKDWRGRIIEKMVFSKDFPYVYDFVVLSRVSMILFIGIGLLVILASYILFSRWVSKPLSKINNALVNGDISDIDELKNQPNEFGQLSQLLENFIIQKKEIERQIIEKIKTEKLLIESEEKFSKAFLFSPAAMMISSWDTNEIITVNESFSKITGLKLKELLGFQVDKTGVFNDPLLFKSIAETLDKNQTVSAYEVFINTKSGDLRFGILKCDIVYLQGKRCLLSVIIDITERKQVEMAMNIAREKAEESDRLKYFLLMNMSHELRTPLTGIIGFAEVIKEDTNEKHIQSLAEKVLISSDRLLSTLNSIMLLAEIHSGNLSLQKQKCNLGETISDVIEQYSEAAKSKSLEIKYIDDSVVAEVDPDHLRQIVERLLDNAIKFCDSGFITVSVSKERSDKNWAVLSVSDTGIGIPHDKLNDIFLEFRQVSEGVGRSFEGSGLGLPIVKNLTTLMGGEIAVESKEKAGSTFYIRFPQVETS